MRPGYPPWGSYRFLGQHAALHQESGQLWAQDTPEHERGESAVQDRHRWSRHIDILGRPNHPMSERSLAYMGR